jgi:hypothetical protein
MNIRVKSYNISIFHRFSGHRNIAANGEGISALTEVLKSMSDLDKCDIIVMQSGPHDYLHLYYTYGPNLGGGCPAGCIDQYSRDAQQLVDFISMKFPLNSTKNKLFWKSDTFYAHEDYDSIGTSTAVKRKLENTLANLLSKTSIKFVNISGAFLQLPIMPLYVEGGSHVGQASSLIFKDNPVPLLWTFISTEVLMNNICGFK